MAAPTVERRRTSDSAGTILSSDPDLHLLRRATFGPTPTLLAEIRQRGAAVWLDEQLRPERIADPAMDAFLLRYPYVSAPLSELNKLIERREASNQLVQATLARQIWSRRQLFEIMVDFWSNHFNVFTPHAATYTTKPIEDRTVIRKYALGRFEDLLLADARSPAMLSYLDNEESQLDEPNENYGRELLQLHTVTPDAGYTEAHVRDSALVLTGRSTDEVGNFLYKPEWHYVGPVRVMGWSSSNASASGGLAVGDSYLRYLARHPQTAKALSRELATRFVSDDPPQSLVDAMAATYLDSGTAIVPCLEVMFDSAEFAAAAGLKTRRPAEDIVATLRVLGVSPPSVGTRPVASLISDCSRLSQPPLGEVEVIGYSDVAAGWSSASGFLGRCNLHRAMSRGYPSGLSRPPLAALLAGPSMATHGEMADRLAVSLTGQVFRADHRAALLGYAGMTAAAPYDQRAVDKWLTDLTEMVLNSPYRMLR